MIKKLKHYSKEVIFFIIFITIFTNIISFYKSTDLNKETLQKISTKLIDNSHYTTPENKPLLVHIWASWCPTCKLEASNIQRLSENYDVITIAVSSGNDYEISQYMKENSFNFKVINDTDGLYAKKFKVAAYPTTFIYDKERNLVFSEVGYTSSLGLYLRMLLADL